VDSSPIFIILALSATGILFCCTAFVWVHKWSDSPDRDLSQGVIPEPEDIILPSLPDGWQAVFPHAGEVFFPKAPHPNAVYEIEVVGECRYHYSLDKIQRADAMYRASHGRFVEKHDDLKLNDKELSHYQYRSKLQLEVVESDRGGHRYKFIFEGDRVGIAFGMAWEQDVNPALGYLQVRVTPLPEGTPGIAWRREQERRRSEEKQEALAAAERLSQAVRTVSTRAQVFRNWEDPEFRDKFARVHYADLIKTQGEIREEAIQLLEQQDVLSYLQRHNPAAVTTALGRLETLLLAERVALDKALAATPPPAAQQEALPPERKKLNAEQVKQIKVRKQQIKFGDTVALAFDRVATKQAVRTHVAEHYGHLDEDEQQKIVQEIFDEIDKEEGNEKEF
jgi:hypothetical protein